MGKIEDLQKLKQLKENGVLNDVEFEIEKAKILNSDIDNNYNKQINNTNNNALSVASFICGIVSIFILPYLFGIASVILGIIGLAKQEDKKTYSIIGIILGILGVLWAIYSTSFLFF